MDIKRCADAASVAQVAADAMAEALQAAVDDRGVATLALSGGSTPQASFEALATRDISWPNVHVVQVDERVAYEFDGDRNLVMQRDTLIARVELASVLPMPVTEATLERAALEYNEELAELTGWPVVLDVVQLGLGSDGHTASLIPNDQALDINDRDVAISQMYQGRQRMTLTVPAIRRARQKVWIVTGEPKREALDAVITAGIQATATTAAAADRSMPATMVADRDDIIVTDLAE